MPEPIGGVQPFAELARNGTTVVYKGYQRAHERFVLLKAVRSDLADEAELGIHLAEEARLAAQVRHPNVVAVLESGTDGPTAYLVTEFVEGLDLRTLVARGPLPAELAAHVVLEAARGLAAVHAGGILHRDLKPANVLVAESGEVKLADFGLASLAPESGAEECSEVRGTVAYLAPEVVRGEAPGPCADLFALGAVLVELLTGRAAFLHETTGATLDAVLHHDPVPPLAADPRVPPALTGLAVELLAKNPPERIASAAALVERLEAFVARYGRNGTEPLAHFLHDPASYTAPTLPDVAEPVAAHTPVSPRPRSPRRGRWVAAAALVVLAALAIGYASLRSEPEPEPIAERLDEAPIGTPEERALRAPADEEPAFEDGEAASSDPTETVPPATASEPRADVAPDVDEESEREASPETVVASEGDTAFEGSSLSDADTGDTDMDAAEPEEAASATGALVVVAEPWAEVRVDGEAVGTTPLGTLTVPVGTRTVTFENPDFPSHSAEVVVMGGGTARLAVSLWELVGRVTLVVSPWARVSVDGEYWDTVPPQERSLILRPGTHRLTFEHPVLGTRETPLRIAAGEARTVRVNLADEQQ